MNHESGGFQGCARYVKQWNGAFEQPQIHSSLSNGFQVAGVHDYCDCKVVGFQDHCRARERGIGIGLVKQNSVFYGDSAAVLNKHTLDCQKLWLISRVLKKIILTIFTSILIAFLWEEWIFRVPYSVRFPRWLSGKESTCPCRRCGFDPWVRKTLAAHCSILGWESHEQRRLVGYSPWGCKESDMTEHTRMHSVTQKSESLHKMLGVSVSM